MNHGDRMDFLKDFIASSSWTTLAAAAAAVLVGVWLLFKTLSMLRWVILIVAVLAAGGYIMNARSAPIHSHDLTERP